MACLFGHKWNGCKCDKCGKTRDQGHDWSGCKCRRCGATRDEHHAYKPIANVCQEKCAVCGKTREAHPAVNGTCSVCGKIVLKALLSEAEDVLLTEVFTLFNKGGLSVSAGVVAFVNAMRKYIDGTALEAKEVSVLSQSCIDAGTYLIAPSVAGKLTGTGSAYAGFSADKLASVSSLYSQLSSKLTKLAVGENAATEGVPQSAWSLQTNGGAKYYTQKADSLYRASEILKKLDDIPPQTYYLVDTADGTLGRDINGFFTEAAIKTKSLNVSAPSGQADTVQAQSLLGFGDMIKNQTSVAHLKMTGEYAKLILMMKCGQCGYESPIETVAGDMERQCYACGANNKAHRGRISVHTERGAIEV